MDGHESYVTRDYTTRSLTHPTRIPVRVPRQVLHRRRGLARVPKLDEAVLPTRHEVVGLVAVEVHVSCGPAVRRLSLGGGSGGGGAKRMAFDMTRVLHARHTLLRPVLSHIFTYAHARTGMSAGPTAPAPAPAEPPPCCEVWLVESVDRFHAFYSFHPFVKPIHLVRVMRVPCAGLAALAAPPR